MINILFTSAGRRSYLIQFFKEALDGTGLVHAANSEVLSPAFGVADKSVVSPLIYDETYIPFLKRYCLANDIKAIVPLFDPDLPVLAKHKAEFESMGVKVIVSDLDVVTVCNDKWRTFIFLKESGLNVPKTFINVEDALQALQNKDIAYPVILKPRWGMGSIALFEADDESELKVFYRKIKKEIKRTYLKYESAMDFENSVLIQEKLPGGEYNLDIINDLAGNYQNTIVKKKFAIRAGETDCAKIVNDAGLKKFGEVLGKKLRHTADLDVDVFCQNGTIYILEMNARFGGGYPFSHISGVNLPLAIVKWLQGDVVESNLLQEEFNVIAYKDIRVMKV